ncbi:MAG: hypothetical protein KDB80_00065 [Planctomycetes bacterium]|nr:hypothetical protein [Planctomycetota bacterium]
MTFARLALGLLLVPSLGAQTLNEHCGSIADTDVSGFSREGGFNTSVAYDILIPSENFRSWGFDPLSPGFHRIDGVRVVLGDADSSTAEMVEIWAYPEDAANPGRPDFTSPAGGYAFPLFGGGAPGQGAAAVFDLTFPAPLNVVDTGDVFLEIYLAGTAAPSAMVGVLFGDTRTGNNFDISNGRGLGTGHGLGVGGYTLIYNFATQQGFFQESQGLITPLCADVAGLAPGTQTNQTSLPGSNAPNLTASWFSGLYPVDGLDRNGAFRQDNIGWIFNDGRYTGGESVIAKFAPIGFGAPIPIENIVPGTGALCLGLTGPLLNFGAATTDATGRAVFNLTIPGPAHGTLTGVAFVYQAFLLTPDSLHVSGCVQQRF